MNYNKDELGKAIAEIHRQVAIRSNPHNPAIDKAMKRLAHKLGIQDFSEQIKVK